MFTVQKSKGPVEIIAEAGHMGLAFMTAKWIGRIIMVPKHLLKITVSMICEPSHAFMMDYYHFRDIIMDYKVKRLLLKRAPKYKIIYCSIAF